MQVCAYYKLPFDKQFEVFENELPGIKDRIETYMTMFKLVTGIDINCKLKLSHKKHKPRVYKLLLINNENKKLFTLYVDKTNKKMYYRYKLSMSKTLITNNGEVYISNLDDLDYPFEYLINHI